MWVNEIIRNVSCNGAVNLNDSMLREERSNYFIFIVPCIVIFYGMTNRCNNVQ